MIISTYSKGRLSYLMDCIESLRKQSLQPDEVILVLDPFPELVDFYKSRLPSGLRIVTSEKRGLSNARNAGVREASGEIVVFIDDDAVADENWLENLVSNYSDPNVIGVGGYIAPLWEGIHPAWFPEELNWVVGCSYKGLPERKANVRNPIGCNMSFRRSVFDEVGYFRSDVGRFGKMLLAGEEPELSLRILRSVPDSRIVYDPSAIVYHKVSKNRLRLKYLMQRSFYEGVSKAVIVDREKNSSASLTVESQYLKYLLGVAIPSKLKRFYRFKVLSELLVLVISSSAVAAGFYSAKLRQGR